MSIKAKETYSSAPNTTRGRSASFDVSPCGKYLIYGSDKNIIIKEVGSPLKVELYTEHKFKVLCARFSPSGSYVCSGDEGGHVIVWSFDNEDRTSQFSSQVLSGPIFDIAWTFDSQRIAIVGEGKKTFTHVMIWNSGTTVGEITGHSKCVLSVDFKPSRPFKAVTGSEDFKCNFYEGPPFKFKSTNSSHSNYVNCVRYSPSGSEYVSVSSDKTMVLHDGKTGDELGKFDVSHKSSIYQVSWSPKGDQLVTVSADKTAKIWDLKSKKVVSTFTFQENELDYMQVGVHWCKKTGEIYTLSLNGNLNILDLNKPKQPKVTFAGHNGLISRIKYDGKKYFYSCGSDGQLIQWEYGTAKNKIVVGKKLPHNKLISALEIVDKFLVVGADDAFIRYVPLDTFKYQAKSSDIKLKGVPCDLEISKDGKYTFASLHNGIAVLDNSSQSVLSYLGVSDYEPTSISENPSTGQIAVGGDDKQVRIYKVSNGTVSSSPSSVIKGHRGPITRLRYSRDGKLLAVGDKSREIIVYDTSDYSPKYTELLFHTGAVTDLEWSSDSKYLASTSLDKSVIIWNLPNKTHLKENAHYQGVRSVTFVDGKTILTAGADFNIKAWNFEFK